MLYEVITLGKFRRVPQDGIEDERDVAENERQENGEASRHPQIGTPRPATGRQQPSAGEGHQGDGDDGQQFELPERNNFV